MNKDRIVSLQRQLKIARDALTQIKSVDEQYSNRSVRVAEDALTEMWKLDPKQPLQGLVGHAPRRDYQ